MTFEHEKIPAQGGEMPPGERAASTGGRGIDTVLGAAPAGNAAQKRNTAAALTDEQRSRIEYALDYMGGSGFAPEADILRVLLTSPRAAVPAPAGWKLVPIERSYKMRAKALIAFNTTEKETNDRDDALDAAHRAMLDAAPAAPAAPVVADGAAPAERAIFADHDNPMNTGVGIFCQPGDRREPRWLLKFEDADRGVSIYESEREAREAFAHAEGRGYNCYLFSPTPRAAVSPATAATPPDVAFKPWHERHADVFSNEGDAWRAFLDARATVSQSTAEKVYYGGSVEAGPVAFDEPATADERAAFETCGPEACTTANRCKAEQQCGWSTIGRASQAAAPADPALVVSRQLVIDWAVERWTLEVNGRPLGNIHRRSLDDTWRQFIRYLGADDVSLLGPRHDDLIAAHSLSIPLPDSEGGEA